VWRQVAIPSEHGGWGLTLEPVLLGLLVAWSWTGLLLGVAAFLAFLVRTPLKVAAVDRRRGRRLARTRVAARFAASELAVLLVLVAWCGRQAGWWWLVPVAVAVPLVGVELWFDVRSRSRRMIPELCGAVAMAGVAAAIVVVGGGGAALAAGAWIVLAARSIASVPFVRVQIDRLHHGAGSLATSDLAQCGAVVLGVLAMAVDHRLLGGLVALSVLAVAQVAWSRQPAVPAKVLGLRQMVVGFGVVMATAVGVWV
jgi:hypothetical protein